MSVLILIVFLLFIFRSVFRRFKRNPVGSFLNPLFYLVLFSSLYLLLPLTYIDFVLTVVKWNVTTDIIYQATSWSIWYVIVFYLFYCKSIDHQYAFTECKLSASCIKCSFYISLFLSLLLLYIIIRYFPIVYAAKSNRGFALSLYETLVNGPFKLRILMYIHFSVILILFWKYRKLVYIFPALLYFIIDYSHGGRTVSVMTFLFLYFLIMLKTGKTYINYAFCFGLLFVILGLLQRSTSTDILWNLYIGGAEFSNTYLTTIYMIQHPEYMHNGFEYILVSLSRMLPGGFVDKLLGFGEWYGNGLSEEVGMGYGLAGNLITEALIYGGKLFAFFNPIFIGGFCFLLNRMRFNKTLFSVLFLLLLCISMQNVVRSVFWGFILYPLQILLFPLFWLKKGYSKEIFV